MKRALAIIGKSSKAKNLQHWVTRLAGLKDLRNKTARRLCRQGILEEKTGRTLFVFPSIRYPERYPEPERQLIARLETALFGDGDVDIRTGILISLTHESGILKIPFDKKILRQHKQRIKDITSRDAIGRATGAAIGAIQAAMAVVAIKPAPITASSCKTGSSGC